MWPLLQLTLSWAAPDPYPRATALWSGTPAVPGSGGLARVLGLSAHVKALLSQPGPPSEVLLDDVRVKGQVWDWEPGKGEMLRWVIPSNPSVGK